ncbi:MAG: hypothetical protein JO122_11775 [Acetobacteraceae bacterium]|nr:hypothetical protein [Acetobacteraceae bacterium]
MAAKQGCGRFDGRFRLARRLGTGLVLQEAFISITDARWYGGGLFGRDNDLETAGVVFTDPGLVIAETVEMLRQLQIAFESENGTSL